MRPFIHLKNTENSECKQTHRVTVMEVIRSIPIPQGKVLSLCPPAQKNILNMLIELYVFSEEKA